MKKTIEVETRELRYILPSISCREKLSHQKCGVMFRTKRSCADEGSKDIVGWF